MIRRFLITLALLPLAATHASAAADPFQTCLAQLRGDAKAAGVATTVFDAQTGALEADMEVLTFLTAQPEFKTPIWDYVAGLVDEERIEDGQAMLAKWDGVLATVEARYGVPRSVVVAVWGVESNYGKNAGKRQLVRSLATLSCFGRRQAFFRKEFFTTLKIIQRGDVNPDHLVGSWAGAFGHTQFMPTTFMRLAVDGDGDGRRDVVDSIPDALASTANYLAKAGWVEGSRWGYEVALPKNFDASLAGRKKKQPLAQWTALGVTRINGDPLPKEGGRAGLLLPAGPSGPAFLVFKNFDAIYAYNAAESYALAIAHLSDRLRGGGAFVTPWPTDDPPLSRAEKRELQTLLLQRGYDIGEPDGILGSKSREAIKDQQRRRGEKETGRAGLKLLKALRSGA
ncbi:MAG: lytic murein transglycosylase [Labrys sp. (in: a-proteobacteria)]|jgi:lytic murein transglycosylase